MNNMNKIYLIFFFFLITISIMIDPSTQFSISLSPTTLSSSGDPVTVSWSGVPDSSWLGIYSPPDSLHDHFIGYIVLNHSDSGAGSVTIPLPNLRSPYSFRIFKWSESDRIDHDHDPLPGTETLIGSSSPELGFVSGRGGAEQVHLALTGREGEMRVLFVVGDGEERFVRYGESEVEVGLGRGRVVAARGERYGREDMCDEPAGGGEGWRDPGWVRDAVMSGLKGGVRYFYQVGSDSKGWSKTHSFVSKDENSDETLAFLFGDMGTATPYSTFYRTQDESITTMKWILRDIQALGDKPSMVSHIGDISYARGYSWIWDHFFTLIEPVASQVPYHVCIGNHEYNWPSQPWRPEWAALSYGTDGGGECGVPYSFKFHMPGNSSVPTGTHSPDTRNLFYSFDMGSVHFVYISTETNFLPGGGQYEFLKNDLESVSREKTPFVVVQGHRPMYTTSNEPKDAPLRKRMIEHLEPLLVDNNVTLALWGHVHRYERFCPMKNYTCGENTLPVHIVIGMAGQDWQPKWEPRASHPDDPVYPQPIRSMYRGGEFGYTRLVADKEKLTLSYVGNHDGEVHDTIEFLAPPGGAVLSGGSMAISESVIPWYVMGGSLFVLGAFIGYVLGFLSRYRKKGGAGGEAKTWIPVKTEDI